MLRDAVDAHGGDRGEHHADGEQAEELAGDGVSGVLQRQPQAPPHAATVQLLELLDVSAAVEGAVRRQHSLSDTEHAQHSKFWTCSGRIFRPAMCQCYWRRSRHPSCGVGCSPVCGRGSGSCSTSPGRTR